MARITSKDGEELDQVAGNAEDEVGERIAAIRETELLYGPESLLALFGPMIVHICGSPHKFKVTGGLLFVLPRLDTHSFAEPSLADDSDFII